MNTPSAPGLDTINIIGYRLVPPDQLLANPKNPRRHPTVQREAVRASLRALGWIAPVLNNVQTGHLLDGHERIEEALSADVALVPVLDIDIPPEKEALALAIFDPITQMAAYDRVALDALVAEAQTDEAALADLLTTIAAYPATAWDAFDQPGDPTAPDGFPAYDSDVPTSYCCPKCGYEWSGGPRP